MNKYDKDRLEELIDHENRILQKCVELLNCRVPLSDWTSEVRTAFLLAVQTGEGREAYKAFSLARHLRIERKFPGYDLPENPGSFQRRCSERIRADLAGLVKLGSGRY